MTSNSLPRAFVHPKRVLARVNANQGLDLKNSMRHFPLLVSAHEASLIYKDDKKVLRDLVENLAL